ncbi:MAG: DNA/RNA non-specific endonuclease [Muribaculaceae bacterium]|nr:DNA/RNA non-specific endonuclease [Muribaculaceae bacterium]
MKKRFPVILSVLFVAMVAAGVIGTIASRPDDTSQGSRRGDSLEKSRASVATGAGVVPEASDLLYVAVPADLPDLRKDYTGFKVSFNRENHTPNWVAWELLGSETSGETGRYNKFWQDTDIEGCPVTRDYSNSGYDRGHMCPAADQKWSCEAMVDCFSLANIVPQAKSLNTGAWKTLESKERLWAQRDSAILIVAGPIYGASDTQRIGETGVRVPGAFFKVLVAPYLAEPRGIAFVYPNMTAPGNMENYVMTIREVEKLTGYDFFHNLPDDIEDAIETASSFRDWNRNR